MEMSEEKTKFCPYCGAQIEYKYLICPSCGKTQPLIEGIAPQRSVGKKNALLAAILSLLITGAGQIYLGRFWRGLAFLVTVLLLGILFDGILTIDEIMIIGVVFSIVSAWDAYRIANEINRS
jgi:TM2 domain-containing membrane protein YozV